MIHRCDTAAIGTVSPLFVSLFSSSFWFSNEVINNTFINILLLLGEKQILRSKVSVAALTDSLYTEQRATWG